MLWLASWWMMCDGDTSQGRFPLKQSWSTPSFPGGWARAVHPSGFFLGTDTELPMGRQPGVCQPPDCSTACWETPRTEGQS